MSSEEHHPALSPLSWLFGVWEAVEANVSYPTMEPVKYKEVMEYLPVKDWPALAYNSKTFHPGKNKNLHCERGYLIIDPETKKLALMSSHIFGITEVAEGTIENESLTLESQSISKMSFLTCVDTVKVVRKLCFKDGELHYTLHMQTANQPLQLHAQTRYKKKV